MSIKSSDDQQEQGQVTYNNGSGDSAFSSYSTSEWDSNPPPIFECRWNEMIKVKHYKRVSATFSVLTGVFGVVFLMFAFVFDDSQATNIVFWSLTGVSFLATIALGSYAYYRHE